MKKIYTNPELVVIELAEADIVTSSVNNPLWMPAGQDQDWLGLNRYTNTY